MPIRVIVRIDTTTYSESVISTPSFGILGAERAHAERHHVHRAAAHAAAVQVGHRSSRISAGSIQLLVGPASIFALGTDEGARFDAGHVGRVGQRQVRVRLLLLVQLAEGARRRRAARSARSHSSSEPSHTRPGRAGQLRDLAHPGEQSIVLGRRRIDPWHGCSRHGALLREIAEHTRPGVGAGVSLGIWYSRRYRR